MAYTETVAIKYARPFIYLENYSAEVNNEVNNKEKTLK